METKVCSKCGEEKPLTKEFFHTDNRNKSGLSHRCKICARKNAREYRENNLEKAKASNLASQKKNRDKRTAQQKLWNENNRDRKKIYSQRYSTKNRDKIKRQQNRWVKKKYREDILFRLSAMLRAGIFRYIKKDKSTLDYLGCDMEYFRNYIENQFQEGMTWENQGRLQNVWGWELDHIIPVSSAKTEEELYKLYHYTNFQPLWKKDNLSKGDKLPEEWLSENTSN